MIAEIKMFFSQMWEILMYSSLIIWCHNSFSGKKQKHLVVTCLECDTIKRFPLNKGYKLWLEKPEAWLDSVQPTENNSTQGTEGKKIINKQ